MPPPLGSTWAVSSGVSPILISSVFSPFSRQSFTGTPLPGAVTATIFWRSCGASSFLPSNSIRTSPATRPALSAGLSLTTSEMSTPLGSLSPKLLASSGVSGWIDTPSQPRVILPRATSSV